MAYSLQYERVALSASSGEAAAYQQEDVVSRVVATLSTQKAAPSSLGSCVKAYQVHMLWILIAVYQLCNVFMIGNQIQHLHFSLYILNILLQRSTGPRD